MSKTVYFLDIDDCLIKTSRLTSKHLAAISLALNKLHIAKSQKITREFTYSFNLLFDNHQGKKLTRRENNWLRQFMQKMEDLEKPILEMFGEIKKWSREVYLYMAAQKHGIKLSNSDLIFLSNSLWKKITQNAKYYSDTIPFIGSLLSKQIHFYLISASDCRLTLDDKTGLFHYDPKYSQNLKLQRLSKLTDLGIPKENIFIADPYDKPNPWVFRQALNQAKKDVKGKFTSVMIGDSLKNDLLPAKVAGMDKFFWLKRNSAKVLTADNEETTVINSLLKIVL